MHATTRRAFISTNVADGTAYDEAYARPMPKSGYVAADTPRIGIGRQTQSTNEYRRLINLPKLVKELRDNHMSRVT